jgi:hypothetical protein
MPMMFMQLTNLVDVMLEVMQLGEELRKAQDYHEGIEKKNSLVVCY